MWGSGAMFDAWLKTAPASVRRLAKEFPFGRRIETLAGGRYVVSWTEDDYLIVSPVNPIENEQAAYEAVHSVAAARHFRERRV